MYANPSARRRRRRRRRPAAKSRMISVRLISMAMTGFFYTFARPRESRPLSMLKYDPVGTFLLIQFILFGFFFPRPHHQHTYNGPSPTHIG